jgi:hypothetical protein
MEIVAIFWNTRAGGKALGSLAKALLSAKSGGYFAV